MKTLMTLIFIFLAMGLSVATMINGYGLHVESLGWIICGQLGGIVLITLPKLMD